LATGSRSLEQGVPAAPVAARFSLLECPEKPGGWARIKGPLQQVRDYIRTGGKQQPKAQQIAARKGLFAAPPAPVSRLFRAFGASSRSGRRPVWCRPADRL